MINEWLFSIQTALNKENPLHLQHTSSPPPPAQKQTPQKDQPEKPITFVLLFARTSFLICLQNLYFSNLAYTRMPSCSGNLAVSGMLILLFQSLFLPMLTSHF